LGIIDFKAATQALVLFAPCRLPLALPVSAPQARAVGFAAQAVVITRLSTSAFQIAASEVSFASRAIWRYSSPAPVELSRFLAKPASGEHIDDIAGVLLSCRTSLTLYPQLSGGAKQCCERSKLHCFCGGDHEHSVSAL
jgi:hypothetical protein